MSAPTGSFHGRCLCGSVRFEARGAPEWVGICHCDSCRRATGGVLITAAGFKRANVTLDGASLTSYASSPGVRRQFCRICGTSLAYESTRWADDIHLFAGAFEKPDQLQPTLHIFWDERLPWLCLSDELPRYRSTPSAGDLADP